MLVILVILQCQGSERTIALGTFLSHIILAVDPRLSVFCKFVNEMSSLYKMVKILHTPGPGWLDRTNVDNRIRDWVTNRVPHYRKLTRFGEGVEPWDTAEGSDEIRLL
jgi:hypothetical protein